MKIALLSCFYPYRGGIAQFNANVFNELSKEHDVKAFNFKRQYPDILFPGKTQYVGEGDSAIKIESERILDTANPLSYIKTSSIIRKWEPNILLMRYWMSYFAPSQGYVARHMLPTTKRISVLDNVIPHERRFFDTPFTKYYLNSNDGFIVLSEAVRDDLLKLKPNAKYLMTPHPVYNHFGAKIGKQEACKILNIDHRYKNILFFGLIREYKGLDILIEAFGMLEGEYNLIIAGEPYGSFTEYQEKIDILKNRDNVKLFTRYISDEEVPLFFSAADVCVLPYRSATQSGISAISYHFELPMITTDVGGLKEAIETPGTGIVVPEPDAKLVKDAIEKFFGQEPSEDFVKNIQRENERLSWSNFCSKLLDFYQTL